MQWRLRLIADEGREPYKRCGLTDCQKQENIV